MSLVILNEIGQTTAIKPFNSLKLFKFTNFNVLSTGVSAERQLSLTFRHSFNSRKWSAIEPLTLSNITTIKVDPLSFFYIEIFCTRTGTDTSGIITVSDVVFSGDFQDISKNYAKIGRFGFRDDCVYDDVQCIGELDNQPTTGLCVPTFKPYDSVKTILNWSKWTNDAVGLFGWDVDYYRVDPETNGRDDFLHEYGTLSFAEKGTVKIMITDNKFPENSFQFNSFDLAMFDAFTISITKDNFKAVFGHEYRPAEMDMIYICQIDKLYKVEHAQAFREFMNASIYYNLTLTKADNDQSIKAMDEMAGLTELVDARALENIVGKNVAKDTANVVNRTEQANLLEERVRKEVYAPVRKTSIDNGANVIANTHYDLANVALDKRAINYLAHDSNLSSGDNRSFTCWFMLPRIQPGIVYNLLNNVDETGQGYRFDLLNNTLRVTWGTQVITQPLTMVMNTWYGIVINIDQRQQQVNSYLYKRHSPQIETLLTTVNTNTSLLIPYGYAPTQIGQLGINGSPLLITNIRLFAEIIKPQIHVSILNQSVVKDATLLLMSDNAMSRLIAPHFKF